MSGNAGLTPSQQNVQMWQRFYRQARERGLGIRAAEDEADERYARVKNVASPVLPGKDEHLKADNEPQREMTSWVSRVGSSGSAMSDDPNTHGPFHLRGGFYFRREVTPQGEEVVRLWPGERSIAVPVNEWASAVASTSKRGETGDTWAEVMDVLERIPASPSSQERTK